MTTAATLIQRTRRYVKDWPEGDVLTASQASSGATLTVADATIHPAGTLIQIDQEAMQVRSGVGTTVTVLRGARGSTAASHANGSTILTRPRFLDIEILDALNTALDACYPVIYRNISSDFTGVSDTVYEYTIPTDSTLGTPIQYISGLQFKVTGDLAFRPLRTSWFIVRGATPFIKFRQSLPAGTLRIRGMGPFAHLVDNTSVLDTLFPVNAEDLLVDYAGQRLILGGEAARAREDTGARDQRDNANRTGAASAVSNVFFQRWQTRLRAAGMPPMGPHVVSVF